MIYLDTNIFLYAIQRHEKYGQPCSLILQEIEDKKVKAFCSAITLAEMIGALQRINSELQKRNQPIINIEESFDAILNYPIIWLDAAPQLIRKSLIFTNNLFGFDCIHRGSMSLYNITEIISADTDFDNISGIKRIDPLKYQTVK